MRSLSLFKSSLRSFLVPPPSVLSTVSHAMLYRQYVFLHSCRWAMPAALAWKNWSRINFASMPRSSNLESQPKSTRHQYGVPSIGTEEDSRTASASGLVPSSINLTAYSNCCRSRPMEHVSSTEVVDQMPRYTHPSTGGWTSRTGLGTEEVSGSVNNEMGRDWDRGWAYYLARDLMHRFG